MGDQDDSHIMANARLDVADVIILVVKRPRFAAGSGVSGNSEQEGSDHPSDARL